MVVYIYYFQLAFAKSDNSFCYGYVIHHLKAHSQV